MVKNIPFPEKQDCFEELKRDYSYAKIPPSDYQKVIDCAWEQGEKAAKDIFEQYHHGQFKVILNEYHLKIIEKDMDFVSGHNRYYSDYLSGKNEITLYTKSIALWAKENQLSMDEAINLILSHELYHYLEMNSIGKTSQLYTLPILQMGKLKIGKTGLAILSEIGAYAFTHTYFNLLNSNEYI
ncbi:MULTISPECIES: hypothetical protein [Terrabacteria group]|uniref:hypothetical protein n=1 Tax=Bacillati TaxID=1783272 RepID=UPI001C6E9CA6|nr:MULTISPECIES: hypothetical protein [Terrabacteria group]MBW9212766.1 hypothetical protein [Trueperella sp. zg.1013]